MAQPPRGLGRGIESLIPSAARADRAAAPVSVAVDKIKPSRYQPRKRFNDESIRELSESIRRQGLIQPLVVSAVEGSDGYELIAGERRWRAAKLAGLAEVPVVVRKVSDQEHFQISLIENIQREDLNPIEEGQAYRRLMDEFKLTQEELAALIGKNRAVVANTLRLLNLPQELQDAVADGTISAGHARNLVSIGDEALQRQTAERILNEKLTVRDVEKIVSDWKGAISSGRVSTNRKDPEIRQIEESLQQALGTKVEVRARGQGPEQKGQIRISFFSLDDLQRVIDLLQKKQ